LLKPAPIYPAGVSEKVLAMDKKSSFKVLMELFSGLPNEALNYFKAASPYFGK